MTQGWQERLAARGAWEPPADWIRVRTLEAHTGGEPLRIILEGFPDLPGDTILAKRRFAREHHDDLRKALMWEPRGHADMYGCLVVPPTTEGADFGVLFLHNEGWSSMCGHGIIAVTKAAVETGLIPANGSEIPVEIDSPAGRISATAILAPDGSRVRSVRFRNVPSFVAALDEMIDVPGFGSVRYDLVFGGAFYAYVNAADLEFTCAESEAQQLIEAGRAIKNAIMASRKIEHPFEEDLGFLYGTIFVAPPIGEGSDSRNVCIFADGELDRSPTGTGVSGRVALHFARGELSVGEPTTIESIVGSRFVAKVAERTSFGPYEAVIPEVEGSAHFCGKGDFLIDPEDPLGYGFFLR